MLSTPHRHFGRDGLLGSPKTPADSEGTPVEVFQVLTLVGIFRAAAARDIGLHHLKESLARLGDSIFIGQRERLIAVAEAGFNWPSQLQ